MARPLTALRLLDAWEATHDEAGRARPVALLAACHEIDPTAVARWSVVTRDAVLFGLHVELFGPTAQAVVDCPHCGARLDVDLDLEALRPAAPAGDDLTGVVDGLVVEARRPSTEDVDVVCTAVDEVGAPAALARRCITSVAHPDGSRVDGAALTGELEQALQMWMAEQLDADDVVLTMACSVCSEPVEAPFDIGTFVLADVDTWAEQAMYDVHTLASAYGWTEAEVLALSARRRARYVDLVEGALDPWPTR